MSVNESSILDKVVSVTILFVFIVSLLLTKVSLGSSILLLVTEVVGGLEEIIIGALIGWAVGVTEVVIIGGIPCNNNELRLWFLFEFLLGGLFKFLVELRLDVLLELRLEDLLELRLDDLLELRLDDLLELIKLVKLLILL